VKSYSGRKLKDRFPSMANCGELSAIFLCQPKFRDFSIRHILCPPLRNIAGVYGYNNQNGLNSKYIKGIRSVIPKRNYSPVPIALIAYSDRY